MPNWCYTQVSVSGDKSLVEKINNAINAAQTTKFAKEAYADYETESDREWDRKNGITGRTMTDFKEVWLGNLLHYAYRDASVYRDVPCRGCVSTAEQYEDLLVIEVESAYVPQLEAVMSLIESVVGIDNPDIDVSYFATEPGNGFFASDQPDMIGQCFCSEFADCEIPADELVGIINEKNGLSLCNIDEAKQYSWEHDCPWYIDGPYEKRSIDEYRSSLLADKEARSKFFEQAKNIIKKESSEHKNVKEDKEL